VRKTQSPVAEIPDIPIFTDSATSISALKPDLVVISSPHACHSSQVRLALESGCHVFVEKPLALDFKEAAELVSLAEARNRLLVVGLQRRYEGFCSVVRELKANDHLGEVLHAHGLFAHTFDAINPTGWRQDLQLAGEGILDDSAYHILDVLFVNTGGAIKQLAGCHVLYSDSDLPHSFSAIFEMDNGAMITASGGGISPCRSVQEEISVFGSKGSVFARRFRQEWNADPPAVFYKSRDGSANEEFDLASRPSGRTLPLQAMIAVLLGQQPRSTILTEARDTLVTHQAVALIKESLRSRN
jgi:predicted dehydrogenase